MFCVTHWCVTDTKRKMEASVSPQPQTFHEHLVASGTSISWIFFFYVLSSDKLPFFFHVQAKCSPRSKTATEPKIATQAHQSDTWEFPHCTPPNPPPKKKNQVVILFPNQTPLTASGLPLKPVLAPAAAEVTNTPAHVLPITSTNASVVQRS